MRALFIFIIIAIILSSSVMASVNYTETGNPDGYFNTGIGRFNQNFISSFGSAITTSSSLASGRLSPLVADLDNDGVNEIIVLDSSTIKLYHGKTFVLVDSFSLGSASATSNMIAYDLGNTGKPKIIIARNSNKDILVLGYNGTDFFNETSQVK